MKPALVLVGLLALAAAASAQSNSEALSSIFADYWDDLLRLNPELATEIGRRDYDDQWSNPSPEALAEERELWQGYLERLQAISEEGLSEQERVSRRLLIYDLERTLEGWEVDRYLLPVNQLFGLHTSVFLTVQQMPARVREDYENRIERLRKLPAYVDQRIALLEKAIGMELVQPPLVARLMAEQTAAQAAPSAIESPLLEAFRNFPDAIPEEEQARLLAEAAIAYRESFQPAWSRLHEFFAGPYLAAARPDIAATTLPNGEEIYRFLVQRFTTTGLSPEEIHEIGRREVERIEGRMLEIVRETGFEGTLAEFEAMLQDAPEQRFASKEEMLRFCRDVAMRVNPELPKYFLKLPRMPVGIRPIPPDREAASASNYSAPAADGSRAGWFNLKTYRPETEVKYDKPALVLHETNPGHHLQIALQVAMEGLPEFRKIYSVTAYIEGWALYAESLGVDMGVYDDPYSRFGMLDSERFRARRLVVDTGLHTMDWTREQAIEYLGDESEIDRYIAWPGQALAYKIGQLKILELRDRAKRELGEAFDIRGFHDVILRNGPLPLDLLERQVEEFLAGKR